MSRTICCFALRRRPANQSARILENRLCISFYSCFTGALLANIDFARGHAAFAPLGHACEGRCRNLSRPRGARRASETHHSAPRFVSIFRGLVCVASRGAPKDCPTHSDGGWLFGGCTAARVPHVPPSACVPAPLSTARGARRRVGT